MMKRMLAVVGLGALMLVAAPRDADAHGGISFGIELPGVAIYAPPPPVYYAPRTYYAPPAYYAPYYDGPGYYRPYYGRAYWGGGHRWHGHRHHHRHGGRHRHW